MRNVVEERIMKSFESLNLNDLEERSKSLIVEFANFLESKEMEDNTIICRRSFNVNPEQNCHCYFPEGYRVGDVIDFTLTTGEKVSAMAMRQETDGMLFAFVDCLKKEYPMNKTGTNEGGYEASNLRTILNGEILDSFPDKIKTRMRAFENGDFLRLLSSTEVFGEDHYDGEDNSVQLEPMKNKKMRIALLGKDSDEFAWYWLQNIQDSASFVSVNGNGDPDYGGASYSRGVRPAFILKQ
jgi:hypothetical protein